MILPFPISVNTAYATDFKTKRRFRSKAYNKWHQAAVDALWAQSIPEWCNGPIKLELALKRPDKRRRDLSNYVKVVEDFLVDMKIIEDDSQVEDLHVFWSEGFEGVKITITPLNPQT